VTDAEPLGSLEDSVRYLIANESESNEWPDWMHTQAIQLSRMLDEIEGDPKLITLFFLLQGLSLRRDIQRLESENLSIRRFAKGVKAFQQDVDECLTMLSDRFNDEDPHGF
jgi:hypothetical protein